MPYRNSTACKDFCSAFARLRKIVKAVSRKTTLNRDITQSAYCAVISHVHSAFETYLYDVLSSWLVQLYSMRAPSTSIPKSFFAYACLNSSSDIRNFHCGIVGEKMALKQVQGNNVYKVAFNVGCDCADLKQYLAGILDKKYPSEKNLELQFARFGLSNIYTELDKRGHSNYRLMLRSLSDKRTSIAHDYPCTSFTFADVVDALDAALKIVRTIDRVLYTHVCATSGSYCWV